MDSSYFFCPAKLLWRRWWSPGYHCRQGLKSADFVMLTGPCVAFIYIEQLF